MKIELFMRSLDQEFTDQIKDWDNGWPYDVTPPHCDRWSYQGIIQNDSDISKKFHPNVRLRSEKFGGLLYNVKTKAVFSLDHEAFKAINLILQGDEINNVEKSLYIPGQQMRDFVEKLRVHQIWQP